MKTIFPTLFLLSGAIIGGYYVSYLPLYWAIPLSCVGGWYWGKFCRQIEIWYLKESK